MNSHARIPTGPADQFGLTPGRTGHRTKFPLLLLFLLFFTHAVLAQDPPASNERKAPADVTATNAPASGDTNSPAATAEKNAASTNQDIQVSFQGANIDMIVQWLAQTTGKSVVKHPQAQCQLTIMSSKKLPPREAI